MPSMATAWTVVRGPLNDDDRARERYGLTAKQLRTIRTAATSGALRRRAGELGVQLPPQYVDNSAAGRMNGHRIVETVV